jgi:molecular chaperone GrpE
MNPSLSQNETSHSQTPSESLSSLDEFMKELEMAEKNLSISEELVVEVEEADDYYSALDENISATLNLDLQSSLESDIHRSIAPDFAEPQAARKERENSALRAQIAKLREDYQELQRNTHRRQTDFDNFRARTEKERKELFQNVLARLAHQILPVLDNMSRALDSTRNLTESGSAEFRQFVQGVVLVNQQLAEVLAEMGIRPISTVGSQFDPHFHEAAATVIDESVAPNTILEELIAGYQIGDKVIRPATVKVSVVGPTQRNPEASLEPAAVAAD